MCRSLLRESVLTDRTPGWDPIIGQNKGAARTISGYDLANTTKPLTLQKDFVVSRCVISHQTSRRALICVLEVASTSSRLRSLPCGTSSPREDSRLRTYPPTCSTTSISSLAQLDTIDLLVENYDVKPCAGERSRSQSSSRFAVRGSVRVCPNIGLLTTGKDSGYRHLVVSLPCIAH